MGKKLIQPKVGEFWMSALGTTVELTHMEGNDLGSKINGGVWKPDGSVWLPGSATERKHGRLVLRVSPDGTPYTETIMKVKAEPWRRLASRMNRAKTFKEAKAIYAKATAKKRGK